MLEDLLKGRDKVIGIKQTTKALNHNKVKTLFISEDADKHLIEHIEQIVKEKDVEVIYVDSMKDLGEACGINVGAAVAAILI